jgi:hypothetical protein
MNTTKYWSLDCDIIAGPQDAGIKIATAVNAATARGIVIKLNATLDLAANDAARITQPDYNDLWSAYVKGAKDGLKYPKAAGTDISRAADAYCKLVHATKDPEHFEAIGLKTETETLVSEDGCTKDAAERETAEMCELLERARLQGPPPKMKVRECICEGMPCDEVLIHGVCKSVELDPDGNPVVPFVSAAAEDAAKEEALTQRLVDKHVEARHYRQVLEWIVGQKDLFFAECSQAEEIITRCQSALDSQNR